LQIFYWPESPRMSVLDSEANEGGTHKSDKFTPYQKAESAIIDCLLLAKSSYLIKNKSSLSDVSLGFNPTINWTQIISDKHPVYSSDELPLPL
jgi:hypothetical protein